jgi:SAM-dependent methyltransferase
MNNIERNIQEKKYFKYRRAEDSNYSIPNYLLKILPLNKEAKILDIGCGLGSLMKNLKKFEYNFVDGIDISDEAYEIGKENGLNIIKIDSILNFKPEIKYDFFVMNHVLEHIDKNEIIKTLTHIKDEILTRNGSGIIIVPNAQSNTDSYWAYEDFTHSTMFTTGSLYYVLKCAGFESINFIDPSGLEGARGFIKYFKLFGLFLYKINKLFWNRVTSSSYHKQSPLIFTFEIKAVIKNS